MVFALDKTHNMLYDITVPTKWRIERYWGRQEKKMNIIKRSGTEVTFDINKIIIAITKVIMKWLNRSGCQKNKFGRLQKM